MEHLRAQAQAFQQLLGLPALPQSGDAVQQAARQLAAAVLAGVAVPQPLLSQLVAQQVQGAGTPAGCRPPRQRFQDVATGMRLRYLEWGSSSSSSGGASDDVVLLLHDLGDAAEAWTPVAARLRERGYRPIAVDLRGHGGSTRGVEARYSAGIMAEDVKAFITALDLYVRPLAVVGAGAGGAVALALAQHWPRLVGALVLVEFTLPAALLAAARAEAAAEAADNGTDGVTAAPALEAGAHASTGPAPGLRPATARQLQLQAPKPSSCAGGSSLTLLPWWSFHPAQAAAFYNAEECAAFLSHPLANLSPAATLPLVVASARSGAEPAGPAGAAQPDEQSDADSVPLNGRQQQQQRRRQPASQTGQGGIPPSAAPSEEQGSDQVPLKALLAGLARPLRGAVASACAMLQPPTGGAWSSGFGAGGWMPGEGPGPCGAWPCRTDPLMLFSFDPGALARGMSSLACHLLLVTGAVARGGWCAPEDATTMVAAASVAGAGPSRAAATIAGGGHRLVTDQPEELLAQLVSFLGGPAILCFHQQQQYQTLRFGSSGSSTTGLVGSFGSGTGDSSRRPELLGLRPLPQYASLEEARKALGPRSIPTPAAVEAELARLRLEEGRDPQAASSDEEEDGGSQEFGFDMEVAGEARREGSQPGAQGQLGVPASGGQRSRQRRKQLGRNQTALAKDPPDYFGFVG